MADLSLLAHNFPSQMLSRAPQLKRSSFHHQFLKRQAGDSLSPSALGHSDKPATSNPLSDDNTASTNTVPDQQTPDHLTTDQPTSHDISPSDTGRSVGDPDSVTASKSAPTLISDTSSNNKSPDSPKTPSSPSSNTPTQSSSTSSAPTSADSSSADTADDKSHQSTNSPPNADHGKNQVDPATADPSLTPPINLPSSASSAPSASSTDTANPALPGDSSLTGPNSLAQNTANQVHNLIPVLPKPADTPASQPVHTSVFTPNNTNSATPDKAVVAPTNVTTGTHLNGMHPLVTQYVNSSTPAVNAGSPVSSAAAVSHPSPHQSATQTDDGTGTSVGTIMGILVAALIGAVVLAGLIGMVMKRQKRSRRTADFHDNLFGEKDAYSQQAERHSMHSDSSRIPMKLSPDLARPRPPSVLERHYASPALPGFQPGLVSYANVPPAPRHFAQPRPAPSDFSGFPPNSGLPYAAEQSYSPGPGYSPPTAPYHSGDEKVSPIERPPDMMHVGAPPLPPLLPYPSGQCARAQAYTHSEPRQSPAPVYPHGEVSYQHQVDQLDFFGQPTSPSAPAPASQQGPLGLKNPYDVEEEASTPLRAPEVQVPDERSGTPTNPNIQHSLFAQRDQQESEEVGTVVEAHGVAVGSVTGGDHLGFEWNFNGTGGLFGGESVDDSKKIDDEVLKQGNDEKGESAQDEDRQLKVVNADE